MTRASILASVGLAAALAAPSGASAATYSTTIADPSGDAPSASVDIVSTRVAYNRRTGALSVSLTTKEPIDASTDDGIFVVALSDLVNGKCHKAVLSIVGVFSSPSTAVAQTMKGPRGTQLGKPRTGIGELDGEQFNLRVRHRSLSGRTPGCAYATVMTVAEKPKLLDETAFNTGFVS